MTKQPNQYETNLQWALLILDRIPPRQFCMKTYRSIAQDPLYYDCGTSMCWAGYMAEDKEFPLEWYLPSFNEFYKYRTLNYSQVQEQFKTIFGPAALLMMELCHSDKTKEMDYHQFRDFAHKQVNKWLRSYSNA